MHTLYPHKKQILDIVAPKGNDLLLMSLSVDCTIKVHDLLTGDQLSEVILEDAPACFCTVVRADQDYLGLAIYVGFHDGKIRKYNYRRKGLDVSVETDPARAEQVSATLEPQEEKKLLEVRHKGRVTAIAYIPELKELLSSGTDDLLFTFTPEGVPTHATGKYKKSFDFLAVVQRPQSLYSSSNFGTTTTKTRMSFHPLNKYPPLTRSTSELGQQHIRPRTLTPIAAEEKGLLELKAAQRFARCMLESYAQGREAGSAQGSQAKVPSLKKREMEELESEIVDLKEKLSKMVSIAAGLIKRLPQRLAE